MTIRLVFSKPRKAGAQCYREAYVRRNHLGKCLVPTSLCLSAPGTRLERMIQASAERIQYSMLEITRTPTRPQDVGLSLPLSIMSEETCDKTKFVIVSEVGKVPFPEPKFGGRLEVVGKF